MTETLTGLIELGGYGGFVWPAYGISAFAIGLTAFVIRRRARQLRRRLDAFDEQGKAAGSIKTFSSRRASQAAVKMPLPPVKVAGVRQAGQVSGSSSGSAS